MERRTFELEVDEFEKLLREIPKVTSESQRETTESGPANSHLQFVPMYHYQNPLPCAYSRRLEPQLFTRLPHGYFRNFPSSGQVPSLELAALSDQLSNCLSFNQPHMSWRNVEDGWLLEESYVRTNPHLCYMYNQSLSDQSKLMSPLEEYCGRLDTSRADNVCFRGPDAINRAKYVNYGRLKHSERLWSQNRVDVDSLSRDLNGRMNQKSQNIEGQIQAYNSLTEARGKIYYMAKDHHGCRFLQRKLHEKDREDIEMIFSEIIDNIAELMTDPFGNYLVQKLLAVCNENQRLQIVRAVTRKPQELVAISCNMHGTQVVQKMIERVKNPEEVLMIISALKPGVVILIKDAYGSHVVLRCFQYLLPHFRKFLFEVAITHCVEFATDRNGCCVLQKCLGHSEDESTNLLVSKVTSYALLLAQDPFGNYVLQYVLELQLEWATVEIIKRLEGHYTELSMQKCSSNVVEKCLKQADEEHRALIVTELVKDGRLDQIMRDPFGNYVIQAALKQCRGTLRCVLVDAIKPHIASLRANLYGKNVLYALGFK